MMFSYPCDRDSTLCHDTATPEIYTLSLHDALPIYDAHPMGRFIATIAAMGTIYPESKDIFEPASRQKQIVRLLRSEEHTSELQSPCNLVCRLLLEKKKNAK